MKNILLVVDVQNGFINSYTENTKNKIVKLLESNIFDIVIATKFKNNEGSNFEKILKWNKLKNEKEQEIVKDIENYLDFIIEKYGYSGYTNNTSNLLKSINNNLSDKVYVVGFDTDGCVLATAVDLFEDGIRPIILADYCASTGGDEYSNAGIKVLQRLIGKNNIVLNKNITKNFIENLK